VLFRSRVSSTWKIIEFKSELPLDDSRLSRIPKVLPHRFLIEYEESIYIDNSIKLLKNPFNFLNSPDHSFSILEHSFRDSLELEFIEVIILELDELSRVSEQYFRYISSLLNLKEIKPLWGGIIYRRHNDKEVIEAMETWWQHILRYSRRDQLSLPIALMNCGLPFQVYKFDNHKSDFHLWPYITRRNHQSKTWIVNHKEILSRLLNRPINLIAYSEPKLSYEQTQVKVKTMAFIKGLFRSK